MAYTIRKIAELAGVSRGTVDKVLHGREGISDEIRAHVKEVIQKTGYVPNRIATELSQSMKEREIVLITTPKNLFIERILAGAAEAEKELLELNCKVKTVMMQKFCEEEQAKVLIQAIESRPDGIVVVGLDGRQTRMALAQAEQAGIPVVTLVSDIDGTNRVCFVGQDIPRGARAAAELLAKAVGRKGEVAVLHGPVSMSAHRERIEYFQEKLAHDFPNVRVCAAVNIHDDNASAYQETKSLLSRHVLDGIYVTGSGVGEVARAVREAKQTVRIVCFDLTKETECLLRSGAVDFVIDQGAFQQGYQSLRILWNDMIHKTRPEKGRYYTDTTIYISELLR